MNSNWLVSKSYARFSKRWALISVLLCAIAVQDMNNEIFILKLKTDVTACSDRLHNESHFEESKNFSLATLFLTLAQDSWWIFTQNILNTLGGPKGNQTLKHSSVCATQGTSNKNFKISPTSIALHCHKKAAALPLPPTHTPVKLHLPVKHEAFAESRTAEFNPSMSLACGSAASNPIINSTIHKRQWTVGH